MDNNYSFCKFRIPDNGKRVIWEITNECNYGCKYCIFASTGRKPVGELDTKQIINVLHDLKNNGFTYIKYTGGEPFLRDDMLEILKTTKSLGLDCDISTNASKIDEIISKELSALDLKMIHVSLDGHTQEIHESVRGKKSFIPTINGIKSLIQFNNKIRIGCVIHEKNQNYIKEMIHFCEELGVSEVIFSIMEPAGRLRGKTTGLTSNSSLTIKNEIESYSSSLKVSHNLNSSIKPVLPLNQLEKNYCPGGDKFLFINSLGDVSPCTWVSEKRPDLINQNIKKASLIKILQSMEQFQSIVKNIPNSCPMEDVDNFKYFEKFNTSSQTYAFTTENLDYMKHLDFSNKDVLTIGGSFDQAIVAYMLGAKKVVNIDINYKSRHWANLKHVGIKYLNFTEFKDFFLRNKNALNTKSFLKLKPYLEDKTLNFFLEQDLLSFRESSFFNNKYDNEQDKIFNSYYLLSESNYLEAQSKTGEFIWNTQNIINVTDNYYDIILLSNLSDYAHTLFGEDYLNKYKTNIVLPLFKKLNDKGTIMLGYVFDALNINGSDNRSDFNLLEKRKSTYQNFNYREINFPSAIKNSIEDCVCLLEKI